MGLRGTVTPTLNTDTLIEVTGPPITDIPYSEYLHIAHDLSGFYKFEDRTKDHHGINLADHPRTKIIIPGSGNVLIH